MPTNDMLARVQAREAARDAWRDERGLLNRTNFNPMRIRRTAPSPTPAPAPTPAATPAPTPTPAASPQNQAFAAFYNTPLYQVPLAEGLDALNANYAARGMLESGAAMKSINDYAAGHAAGGLRDYMSLLGNQQAIGFNAASGQAGANQNYANTISGMNTNYGNALSNANSQFANNASGLTSGFANAASGAAGNLGNAIGQGAINTGNILGQNAIAQANNTNSMIGGIGSALGNLGGFLAYRPYGG